MAQVAINNTNRMALQNECTENDYSCYDDDDDLDTNQMNYDETSNQNECYYDEEPSSNHQQTNREDLSVNDLNGSKARPYADKPSSHLKDLYGYVSRRVGEEMTKGYECKLCSQIFDLTRDILIHLNEMHGENIKIFICEMCPFASAYRPSVRRHRMEAHKLDGSGTPQLNPSGSGTINRNVFDPAIRQITNQQHTAAIANSSLTNGADLKQQQPTAKTYECNVCNFKCHEFIMWKRHRRSARHKLLKSQLEFGQPTENMNQHQLNNSTNLNNNSFNNNHPYHPHHHNNNNNQQHFNHQRQQQMNPMKSNQNALNYGHETRSLRVDRQSIDLRDPYDTKMMMLGEIMIDFQDLKAQMNRLHSDFNNMDAHIYNLDERVNNIDSRLARVEDSLDSVLKFFESKMV